MSILLSRGREIPIAPNRLSMLIGYFCLLLSLSPAVGNAADLGADLDCSRLGEDRWDCVKPTAFRVRAEGHQDAIDAGKRFDMKGQIATFEVDVVSARNCTQTWLEVEVAKNGSPFTGQPTTGSEYKQLCVDLPDGVPCPASTFNAKFKLQSDTDYRWRARTKSVMRTVEIGNGWQVCKEANKVFYSDWMGEPKEGVSFSTTAGWMQTEASPPLIRTPCAKTVPGNPNDYYSVSDSPTCKNNTVELQLEYPINDSKSSARNGSTHVQIETDVVAVCRLIGITAKGDRDVMSGSPSPPNSSVEVELGTVSVSANSRLDVIRPLHITLPDWKSYEMVSFYDRTSWSTHRGVVITRLRCEANKPFRLRLPQRHLYYQTFLYGD